MVDYGNREFLRYLERSNANFGLLLKIFRLKFVRARLSWESVNRVTRLIQVFGAPIHGAFGGHEYVVRRLSEELAMSRFEVKVLCPTLNSKLRHRQVNGVDYVEIPSFKLHDRAYLPKLSSLKMIVKVLKEVELVNVHSPDNPFSFIVALISTLLRKSMVATVLAYADDFKHHDKMKRLLGLFTSLQQTITVWMASKVHVESAYDAAKLYSYSNKVNIIPPAVEGNVLTSSPSQQLIQDIKGRISYHDGEKIVLYLGRVHKAKGIDHAIYAIYILNKDRKNVKLVVVGPDGGFLKEARKLTEKIEQRDKVVFLGPFSEEEKVAVIDLANVVVIPSLSDVVEAYSLVASEAWARGKLVVAYNVGALKYRIKNGVNGYLANQRDPIDLSKKIALALSDEKEKSFACDDVWVWSETVDAFKQLYATLDLKR